jgi:hypothetical protein
MEASLVDSRQVKTSPEKKQREFITSDLPMTAFLQTQGHNLLRVERQSRRLTFFFADSFELGADKMNWINDEAIMMRPRSFATAMKQLKVLIFNAGDQS